jgi:thioredoxin-like negative regulator of GroEL
MEKVYEKLEPFFAGKVEFVKVDINSPAEQDLVRRFNVRLVPTSVFIGSDGKVVAKKIGAMPLDETKTILIGLRKQ